MEKPRQKILIGVATTVIGGLILRYTTGITLSDLFGWIPRLAAWLWHFAVAPVAMPRWAFALIAGLAIVTLWRFLRSFRSAVKEPSEFDYLSDRFEGLVWRWRYNSIGHISDTWCYCPHCDNVLVYEVSDEPNRENGGYYGGWHRVTHFKCELCRERKATLEGDRDAVVSRIQRLIDRKLRTGEWRGSVTRQEGRERQA